MSNNNQQSFRFRNRRRKKDVSQGKSSQRLTSEETKVLKSLARLVQDPKLSSESTDEPTQPNEPEEIEMFEEQPSEKSDEEYKSRFFVFKVFGVSSVTFFTFPIIALFIVIAGPIMFGYVQDGMSEYNGKEYAPISFGPLVIILAPIVAFLIALVMNAKAIWLRWGRWKGESLIFNKDGFTYIQKGSRLFNIPADERKIGIDSSNDIAIKQGRWIQSLFNYGTVNVLMVERVGSEDDIFRNLRYVKDPFAISRLAKKFKE
mgnify:CR=1 FL=1